MGKKETWKRDGGRAKTRLENVNDEANYIYRKKRTVLSQSLSYFSQVVSCMICAVGIMQSTACALFLKHSEEELDYQCSGLLTTNERLLIHYKYVCLNRK